MPADRAQPDRAAEFRDNLGESVSLPGHRCVPDDGRHEVLGLRRASTSQPRFTHRPGDAAWKRRRRNHRCRILRRAARDPPACTRGNPRRRTTPTSSMTDVNARGRRRSPHRSTTSAATPRRRPEREGQWRQTAPAPRSGIKNTPCMDPLARSRRTRREASGQRGGSTAPRPGRTAPILPQDARGRSLPREEGSLNETGARGAAAILRAR